MKLFLFVYIFLCVFSQSSQGSAELPDKVTLEDAKKYAITNNLDVLSLRHALEEAKSKVTSARSSFYPHLGVAGGVDYQAASNVTQGAPVGYFYGNWNIFRGLGDTYKIQMADIEVERAERQLKQGEFKVGLEIEQLFQLYLFKKTSIELRENALKDNQKLQKMALQRRRGGYESESDVMEFDLRDSFLKTQLAALALDVERARVNLRRQLGEKIGEKIEPVGSLQHYKLKGSLGEYLKKISTENEKVVGASRDLAKAGVEEKLARSKWFPEIDLETQLGYLRIMDRPNSSPTDVGGAAFKGLVLAKLDIFQGFDTTAKLGEASARKLRAEAELKRSILDVVSKAEISYRTLKSIEATVGLEEQNSTRAERYYKSVLKEYQRGVKNSSDVKNAHEQLFQAQVRREEHKYEYIVEKAELERLLGSSLDLEIQKEL